MTLITKIFPPVDKVLQMEPEELAIPLLECLCQFDETKSSGMLNRYNFTLQSNLQEYVCEKYRGQPLTRDKPI